MQLGGTQRSAATPAPVASPTAVVTSLAGLPTDVAAFLNGWMDDWQARNERMGMGPIAGDTEFIPLPERRFVA